MGLKRLIKRKIVHAVQAVLFVIFTGLGVGARLLRWERRLGPPDPASVRKILVIRLDLLGDVVNSMTAVEALHERFPRARITMLTLPHTAPIVRRFSYVAEVLTLD
ncbi:MAG: glycosyltransferase family 9 protein, partial [Chloroflexota bacterium]